MRWVGPARCSRNVDEEAEAREIVDAVAACAWRIEHKFSRYRTDNIVARINASAGEPVEVDDETANLLDFAALVHRLSDGMFDITSGVLRRAWSFDGGHRVPTRAEIDTLLPLGRLVEGEVDAAHDHIAAGHADRFRRHRQGIRGRSGHAPGGADEWRAGARQLRRRSRRHARSRRQSAMARGHRRHRHRRRAEHPGSWIWLPERWQPAATLTGTWSREAGACRTYSIRAMDGPCATHRAP